MHSKQVKKIVIVGGGTAGWMAAAMLACRYSREDLAIQLVESDAIATVGVGEATVPGIIQLHQHLGVKESEFVSATNATFKLGIEFKNWSQLGATFFHPFAKYGAPIAGQAFFDCWLRLKQAGYTAKLDEFSLSIALAKANKFVQPDDNATNQLAMFGYAYHFDATLYAKFLRAYAEQRGVQRTEGLITQTYLQADGNIECVELASGEKIAGDLFFDCSGFRGLLIEEALQTGYQDWSHWLPCNKAVAVQTINEKPPTPYTRSTALAAGWQWTIPLQNRIGNGYVFCDRYISDDEAIATLTRNVEGEMLTEPRVIGFNAGVRNKFWNKNCVAIGLASGFVEPLESTSISLIQTGVEKIMDAMPALEYSENTIASTNSLNQQEYERIRDFIVLHYKASAREDSAFWRDVRAMDIPTTLQNKMSAYLKDATFIDYGQESFKDASWQTMYNGFNLYPQIPPSNVADLDVQQLMLVAEKMRAAIQAGVAHAPSHAEFLSTLADGKF